MLPTKFHALPTHIHCSVRKSGSTIAWNGGQSGSMTGVDHPDPRHPYAFDRSEQEEDRGGNTPILNEENQYVTNARVA